MKYILVNSCPARQIDLHDRQYKCFITGNICDWDDKFKCEDYRKHIPKLETTLSDEERQFEEDRKYRASKGLVF